jgi:NADH-quinone oxidoreductase subunit N
LAWVSNWLLPFHLWTPDVYEGAPAPVTAFVSTASKGAVFAVILRYFSMVGVLSRPIFVIFTIIAIASMFTGNLLALFQSNVKRILAYSSISHLGYILVTLLASGAMAATAAAFYLSAYFITTLGAFGVVTVLSEKDRDADSMDDYRGLAWRRPWLAGVFTAMLLSLAGIPLTAGFVGKFYVAAAGVGSGLWLLVIILAVNSALGLYYYLRIIVALYMRGEKEMIATPRLSLGKRCARGLTVILIWLRYIQCR